jgi:cyclic pyranopterin phosphate synthase
MRTSARMIDISNKNIQHREAVATGKIVLREQTIAAIKNGKIEKGDPLRVAEIAGILAVKKTSEIIPLCHPIPLTSIETSFEINDEFIKAVCKVTADYKTGVEMEAICGVTTSLLTIWDMVKYLEKDKNGQYPDTAITDVRVIEKRKG